jgi:membrane-bound lytic murein transglycosylase B
MKKYCGLKFVWALFFLMFLLYGAGGNPARANPESFESWLAGLRIEAREAGISERTIAQTLSSIQPIARVIELDRKQPEGRMSFAEYKKKVINQQRIDEGRELYRAYGSMLKNISAQYGVPAQYIVALWGLETSYGNNTGGFKVIPALATLAYDGRRSEFFRKELINALKIIDGGHIAAENMKGSWAGAMGQNQFMPSSFHAYAVDGNGDGKRDIWNTIPDVFASTANYLSTSGWREDERWGREVTIPQGFSKNLLGLETQKSVAEWSSLGVRDTNGQPITGGEGMRASLVAPDGPAGRVFMVYGNYRVIMKWNKSTYFATSVGLLADQIAR